VLGLTFKEDCPDLRNTRVVDVITELQEFGVLVDVHDPIADPDEARREYSLDLIAEPQTGTYEGIVLAVAHEAYRNAGANTIRAYGRNESVFYDVKSVFAKDESDLRL
jgi:UDP-N-acetyl-D-galactosamine dehydrogenase